MELQGDSDRLRSFRLHSYCEILNRQLVAYSLHCHPALYVQFGTQHGQPLFRLKYSVTLEGRSERLGREKTNRRSGEAEGETESIRSRFRFGLPFGTRLMHRVPKSQLSMRGCDSEVLVIDIPGGTRYSASEYERVLPGLVVTSCQEPISSGHSCYSC
jgi:hypothetical protein